LAFEGRSARLVPANDITEKKLLQEKFLHAQRLESLGTLASGIAHDLNNMLAPIIFAGPLLRQSCTSPGELELINILERCSERGASLVRQILAFAHGTTGEPQLTQVKHLARDIGSLIEKTFPKAIQFEAGIPSDLWPAVVNPTQIHQILLNLCVNARDAMPQGGTLSLRAANRRLDSSEADAIPGARPGSWLVLEVADTGTGIRPEDLPHIWEPFFTTKAPEKGTGLGLATVVGIVSAHHGFIQLETAVGRGATFRIFLPANPVKLPRTVVPALSAVPRGNGEFILVVDDDEAIRDIVAAILSQHGYQVVTCADGIEALTRFNAQPKGFPVVITDVDMPLLSGAVLAGVIRQLQPDVRLLAMSGLSGGGTDGSDVRAIKELAHAFLAKPFLPEDLLLAVHRILHPPPAG
jgi:nitrogen-specific signal transduction histidine kinase/CheY-like chemotaxis protein